VVAALFLVLVVAILLISVREWLLIALRRKTPVLHETPPVWLPQTVIDSENRRPWWKLGTAVVIIGALARELSGEAAAARSGLPPDQALAQTLAHKYDNSRQPGRCC
jgi:hypothetical protein